MDVTQVRYLFKIDIQENEFNYRTNKIMLRKERHNRLKINPKEKFYENYNYYYLQKKQVFSQHYNLSDAHTIFIYFYLEKKFNLKNRLPNIFLINSVQCFALFYAGNISLSW